MAELVAEPRAWRFGAMLRAVKTPVGMVSIRTEYADALRARAAQLGTTMCAVLEQALEGDWSPDAARAAMADSEGVIVSLRGQCVDKIRHAAKQRGTSMRALLEQALEGDDWSPEPARVAMMAIGGQAWSHAPHLLQRRPPGTLKGTLPMVEQILRVFGAPMSVPQIVDHAGDALPSKSQRPRAVVARDLAVEILHNGDWSPFVRTARGRYTLRALVAQAA